MREMQTSDFASELKPFFNNEVTVQRNTGADDGSGFVS
jgi:hypothetical protein